VARLDRSYPQPSALPLVAGFILFVMAWLSLLSPQAYATAPYPQLIRQAAQMKAFLLSSGVFLFVAYAAKMRRDGWLPIALAATGTTPYWVTAALAYTGAAWVAFAIVAILAGGVLADVVRPWRYEEKPARRIPTLIAVMAAIGLALGTIALVMPDPFRLPADTLLRTYLRPLAGGLLASSLVLAAGCVWERFERISQIVAAVPLAAIAAGFGLLGRWPSLFLYGALALVLAGESFLYGFLRQRSLQRDAQPPSVSQFEMATEGVAWGFTLLTTLVASVTPDGSQRLTLSAVMTLTCLFTAAFYHVVPIGSAGLSRTVFASGVYSFMVAVLVQATGSERSPYFFVSFLPILPLAWTQAPQTIIVPLAIPLGALIIGLVLEAVRGQILPLEVLTEGLPRIAGLLLVSGFTYLLAKRNLQSRNRIWQAHRSLETVLTSMGEGLVATDESGRITLCNPAAASILGLTPRDIIGESLTTMLPLRREDGTPVAQNTHPMWRALAGHQVPPARFIIAGQASLPAAVAATPLGGTNGNHGAIILLRDARAESEVERMREDFFNIASHELRTPLTVIKGNLEMALEESPAPGLQATIQEALSSTGRLIRMVNDFLDAARLDHGSVSMRIETSDLSALIHQAVETMRPDAERKGLTITYQPLANLPPARMDSERVLQILINLIGNSVRYTQTGSIEISHVVDGKDVETLVKDTGIGIPAEHHDRLFIRFGQVERGLRRGGGGSGLGLYISKKLAEQMGGTIVLKESVPGQGSIFALRLPVAAAEPVAVH
jgi:signal transduction histidine kinase